MAAGQTVLTYGSMVITNCLTQPGGFAQEPIFDESDTDMMYYRFIVRVTGYVHGLPSIVTVGVLPNYGANSAALSHRAVRYTIAPRKPFLMQMGCDQNLLNGQTILQCNPATSAQWTTVSNRCLSAYFQCRRSQRSTLHAFRYHARGRGQSIQGGGGIRDLQVGVR